MNTAIATKVTSVGSTSGAPTPPNPTPCTESSTANTDHGPQPDFDAVDRILGPIQEDLNEQADVATLPSPPINTPELFSPAPSAAPSVIHRVRGRGFSLVGDRLAQLKLQERSSPRSKDSDAASSNRSIVTSIEEDETEHVDDDASFTSNWSTPKNSRIKIGTSLISPTPGYIPIALGSARINPNIDAYMHFSSKDLPVTSSAQDYSSSTQVVPALDGHTRDRSLASVKSDGAISGVTEKSTWAEEVEDAAERAFCRLEQLAFDEFTINPSRTLEDHYVQRLQRLLTSSDRKFKVKVTIDYSAEDSEASTVAPTDLPEETTEEPVSDTVAKVVKK